MLVLRRISTCPTIPEMIDAEFLTEFSRLRHRLLAFAEGQFASGARGGARPTGRLFDQHLRVYRRWILFGFYLTMANVALGVASVLLRFRLIDAHGALLAISIATSLSRASMRLWRAGRLRSYR